MARPLRDTLIYLTWKDGRHSLAEVGRYFGVGYTSIVNARKRGARYVEDDKGLRKKLEGPVK